MSCRLVLLLLFLAISSGSLQAQGISYVRTFAASEYPWGTAMDASGVYVIAMSTVAAGWAGGDAGVLRKFEKGGGELWARQLPTYIYPGAVAVTAGAVYVGGFGTEVP
ncbi:MAG: hypothetical protein L0Z53_27245, partial [Acidobacteriales bacterium]|nr:hypothetical protein [Terriglobales bacterium]